MGAGTSVLKIQGDLSSIFGGSISTTANMTCTSLISTNTITTNVTAKTTGGNIIFRTNGGSNIAAFKNNLDVKFYGNIETASGATGFTGTGAYTTLTIENGIITNAV